MISVVDSRTHFPHPVDKDKQGHRRGSDLSLLWLWCRPAPTAPIQPLAWEPPYAAGMALEKAKRQKKKERERIKGAKAVVVVLLP